jgi:uncharacterized protein
MASDQSIAKQDNFGRARRRFLKIAGAAGIGALGLVVLREYARRVAPWQLSVERVEIRSARIPRALDGFTIGQISDLHIGSFIRPAFIQRAVTMLNALQPDIVAITGDLKHDRGAEQDVHDALRGVRAPMGSYVTFGNHDHWNDAAALLPAIAAQHTPLLNKTRTLSLRGTPLHIVGVDDIWEGAHDLDRALAGIPADEPAILLAHEPDYADEAAARHPFVAMLSGHTHGGQVRLPFIGAPALPPFGRKYVMGRYTINDMALYVTRGVGMALPTYRFLCPPEVTLVTLRA